MNLNKVKFNESIHSKNGYTFEFKYEGNQKNDVVDTNKVHKLITKFMNQIKNHEDMITNVRFLRTILKEYDEQLLILNYQNSKVEETIKFDNCHMSLFEKTEKISLNNFNENFSVKYTSSNNISFTFTDSNNNIIDYSNVSDISNKITEVLKEIETLNCIEPIELDQNAKTIVEMYKLFYNENPDFSDENINLKIQTMLSILSKFLISVDDYSFSFSSKRKFPVSISLSNLIFELFPLGEIMQINEPIKIREDVKKKIIIIGEEIKNTIKSTSNQKEALTIISKIMHATSYNLPSTASIEEIAKYTNCSNSEVESCIKLVKKINNLY